MTATFFNCQQNILLEKVFETKPSVGYFFLRNLLWQVWDVSQKFYEKKTSFWTLFLRNNYLVIFALPLLVAKWRRPLGGSSWKLLEITSVRRFLAYCTATGQGVFAMHVLCLFMFMGLLIVISQVTSLDSICDILDSTFLHDILDSIHDRPHTYPTLYMPWFGDCTQACECEVCWWKKCITVAKTKYP